METLVFLMIVGVIWGSDRDKPRNKIVRPPIKPKVPLKPEYDCEPKWIG